MQEISLNILDLAQNSITAGATLITVTVNEQTKRDTITVSIADNGRGMTKEQLSAVTDPFFTTRKTRKVGLGVPFFKMAAEMSGGSFEISSQPGRGTSVKGVFGRSNIDRMPLGDVNGTMISLIQCNPSIDFVYKRCLDSREYVLDTREMRKVLGDVPLNEAEVVVFIKQYLCDGDKELIGGDSVEKS